MYDVKHRMNRFLGFRPNIPEGTHSEDMENDPEKVQFEGVIMTSGKCVIQWKTAVESMSIFDSYDQFDKIHGHPEYGSIIIFIDESKESMSYGRPKNCS